MTSKSSNSISSKSAKTYFNELDVSIENMVEKLSESLSQGNLLESTKIIGFVDILAKINNSSIVDAIEANSRAWTKFKALKKQWQANINEWKASLTVGSQFDNYHEVDKTWYRVKIIKRDEDEITIHYQGWDSKYDKTISLKDSRSFPSGFRVKDKSRGKQSTGDKELNPEEPLQNVSEISRDESQEVPGKENTPTAETDELLTTRSGRKIPPKTESKAPVTKKSRKSLSTEEEKDKNDWMCGVCQYLESEDGSELILCDGPCMRSFHLTCLNITEAESAKIDNNDKWLCEDCTNKTHCCFICKGRGVDGCEVFKCHAAGCGKYYHHPCLNDNHGAFLTPPLISKMACQLAELPPIEAESEVKGEPMDETSPQTSPSRGKKRRSKSSWSKRKVPSVDLAPTETDLQLYPTPESIKYWAQLGDFSYRCPFHYCDTCFEFYGEGSTKSKVGSLHRCIKCPRAFHINCIPPGSRFNAMCLLCPLHPDDVLPSKLKPNSEAQTEFAWLWDQMPLPESLPDADALLSHHFRLSTIVKADVECQPTDFKMISRLDYDSLPAKRKALPFYESEDHCNCTVSCDENCINRILNVECCDNTSSLTKFQSNCNVANQLETRDKNFDCGNRQLQNKEYIRYEKFREFNRGFGLRSLQDAPEGTLIIEYIGEVIDEGAMIQRMTDQRKFSPSDHDFYIMQLDTGYYVDGKFKGNPSRFINHSCDPNCELQRWIVQGTMRIGIFAIRDIKAGDALSYDYQFDTREENIFRCYCESANCRGTMAPAKKAHHHVNQFINKMQMRLLREKDVCGVCTVPAKYVIDENALAELPAKDRRKLVELGRNEEMKRLADDRNAEQLLQRSYVSNYLPGDGVHEIRGGPLKTYNSLARKEKLFLPRVLKYGADFLRRKRLASKKDGL